MPSKDATALKEYRKAWHQKNKERHNKQTCEWQKKNRHKRNAYMKAWRAANRERSRRYVARYREKYPEKIIAYNDRPEVKQRKLEHGRQVYERNATLVRQIKAERGCIFCRERDPICLDFHHRDRKAKKKVISQLKSAATKQLMEEIAKCEVICSNCHRKLHSSEERKTWWRERLKGKALVENPQEDVGCEPLFEWGEKNGCAEATAEKPIALD